MKNWWVLALGVVFGFLSGGILFLASQPPHGNAIALLPPPTPIPIHISGKVQNSGVYALLPGSRVDDAIAAAGGFLEKANTINLNLAAPLEDDTLLQVPAQPPVETPIPTVAASSKGVTSTKSANSSPVEDAKSTSLININTASQEELKTLSGIGPATALKIITFRDENGPFTSIEEIQKVSGIGPVTFEKIKDFITVDDVP